MGTLWPAARTSSRVRTAMFASCTLSEPSIEMRPLAAASRKRRTIRSGESVPLVDDSGSLVNHCSRAPEHHHHNVDYRRCRRYRLVRWHGHRHPRHDDRRQCRRHDHHHRCHSQQLPTTQLRSRPLSPTTSPAPAPPQFRAWLPNASGGTHHHHDHPDAHAAHRHRLWH